jgi:hypothetical protein
MFLLAGELYARFAADAFLVMGALSVAGFFCAVWLSQIWHPNNA